MSFELVGQHWPERHAAIISFFLWNSSLIRDCMFEVIDEHIRETERPIMAWLCLDDFFEIQIQCQIIIPLIICFFASRQVVGRDWALLLTEFTGRQNYKINKKSQSLVYCKWPVCGSDSWILFSRQHDTFSLLSVSLLYSSAAPFYFFHSPRCHGWSWSAE